MTKNLTLAKETVVCSKYESIPDSSVIAFFDFETINDNTGASTGTKPVVGVLRAGPAEIFGSDTELPSLVDGVGAVSYTHLDVYKRQGQGGGAVGDGH